MVACTWENEVSSFGVLFPCGFEEAAKREDTEGENKSLFPCMSKKEDCESRRIVPFSPPCPPCQSCL